MVKLKRAHHGLCGQHSSFDVLFHTHYDAVHALAYRMCCNHHDAEDISQEVFIRVAKNLNKFEQRSSFKTWLYRITMNVVASFHERVGQKQSKTVSLAGDPDWVNDKSPAADTTNQMIRQALESISFEQRQAIVLTAFECLSHQQAAGILGCAEKTISWRIHQARKKLRDILAERLDHERS